MLNLRSKLLKIIFIAFAFIFFGINSTFGMDSAPAIQQNDQRYAKVVFLGYFGSGKTVLYNLLTNKSVSFDKIKHTKQIDTAILGLNINGTKVDVYLNDTSAEPKHKDVMNEFCKNAHVVFLIVDALKLAETEASSSSSLGSSLCISSSQMHFEDLVCRLDEIAPKCRAVVVLTKKGLITKKKYSRAPFIKSRIEQYVQNIKSGLAGDEDTKDIACFLDKEYDLTLANTTDDKAIEHRNNLYNIIATSLQNYGLENLPKEPKGFLGKIFEEDVYTQKKFLFWEYGKEFSHTNYSLIRPDKKDDEKKPYLPKTNSSKTLTTSKCAIF